ncbi:MAG: hypothetical protein HY746_08405 [Elusimicrobia bacterium]|nr:hypothetical protein [Elusimicrobiota bacterium]
MNEKQIQPFGVSGSKEDVVEPEIVDDGAPYAKSSAENPNPPSFPPLKKGDIGGFLIRLKLWLFYGLVLGGIILVIPGFLLVSTIIGAIIGIPLILLGISAIWLAFKILLSGKKTQFFFIKNPHR